MVRYGTGAKAKKSSRRALKKGVGVLLGRVSGRRGSVALLTRHLRKKYGTKWTRSYVKSLGGKGTMF